MTDPEYDNPWPDIRKGCVNGIKALLLEILMLPVILVIIVVLFTLPESWNVNAPLVILISAATLVLFGIASWVRNILTHKKGAAPKDRP